MTLCDRGGGSKLAKKTRYVIVERPLSHSFPFVAPRVVGPFEDGKRHSTTKLTGILWIKLFLFEGLYTITIKSLKSSKSNIDS